MTVLEIAKKYLPKKLTIEQKARLQALEKDEKAKKPKKSLSLEEYRNQTQS